MKPALTSSQEVFTQMQDGVFTITINRPKARNAINLVVAQQIAEAMDALDARGDLRVGILTGAHGTFCAGMDLKGFLQGERPNLPERGFGGLTKRSPRKPLIAAVEGYALAGGFELALACDLIVASSKAQFGLPEVKRGLVATAGGLLKLPQQLPYRVAMELALTGSMLSAARAFDLGLVNRITEEGGALAVAHDLAMAIAANSPVSVAASKRVVMESRDWPDSEMWSRQAALTDHVYASDDAQEGAKAFSEKRAPVWQGR